MAPIEAFDKLTGKKRMSKSHTIYRLPLHLENRQNIVYNIDNVRRLIRNPDNERIREPTTMLMGYFELNRTDQNARQYLYKQIPEVYWWDKQEQRWKLRQNINRAEKAIGRLHYIHARNRELFHLKLLLLNVRGATSFVHLRTVNEVEHPTFTEAAIALNLVNNNNQWNDCLNEIIRTELPHRIR